MLIPAEDNPDDYLLPDPSTMAPGLIENVKQHLLFLLHAKVCMQRDEESRATETSSSSQHLPCILPWCHEFKQLIEHMLTCRVGLRCDNQPSVFAMENQNLDNLSRGNTSIQSSSAQETTIPEAPLRRYCISINLTGTEKFNVEVNTGDIPFPDRLERRFGFVKVWFTGTNQAKILLDNEAIFSTPKEIAAEKRMIQKEVIESWCMPESAVITNYRRILSRLEISPDAAIHLVFDSVPVKLLRQILVSEAFMDWESVEARYSRIPSGALDYIVGIPRKELRLRGEIREDFGYEHYQPLKCRTIDIEDARWVDISNMWSIRGVERLKLGMTKFTCDHMNNFICELVEDGSKACKKSSICLDKSAPFIMELLLKDLVTLQYACQGGNWIYILTKSQEEIVTLSYCSAKHCLKTTVSSNYDSKWFEVLKLLQEKQKLDKSFDGMRKEEDPTSIGTEILENHRKLLWHHVLIVNGRAAVV